MRLARPGTGASRTVASRDEARIIWTRFWQHSSVILLASRKNFGKKSARVMVFKLRVESGVD